MAREGLAARGGVRQLAGVPDILEILERSTGYLEERGVEQPRLEAELLLAHVLGCQRLDLYLRYGEPLKEAQLAPLRELVRRRGKREPWQYLTGEVDFHELKLKVDRRALIPRPETEELVELLRQRLKPPPGRVLDIGTGSGAIALACARMWPETEVLATDVSAEALSLARENAANLGLEGRVALHEGDLAAEVGERSDLIVSNPPYLTEEEWQEAAPEVREFEPKGALVGGAEGREVLTRLIELAPRLLRPGGWLALETGIFHHPALEVQAREAGLVEVESVSDFHRRPRYLLGRMPG